VRACVDFGEQFATIIGPPPGVMFFLDRLAGSRIRGLGALPAILNWNSIN
jgi:hypothetical protein